MQPPANTPAHARPLEVPAPAAGAAPPAGPPAGPMTLPDMLKERTMDLHMAAERHAFHRAMFKGEASWQAYLEQTAQTLLVQDALERALRLSMGRSPALAAVVREHHFRAGMIRDDLRACGVDPGAVAPLHATRAMLSAVERDAGADPAALLGAMYVLEGSTNGAKFIKTALQRAYRKSDDTGLKWLDPHGEHLRERWHGFRAGVAGLGLDEATNALILARARDAFAWTIGVMDELCAKHAIDMKPAGEHAHAGAPMGANAGGPPTGMPSGVSPHGPR